MPDRRGRKGRSEDLLPKDRLRWAREVWEDREACARTAPGIWMLREAATVLGLPEEVVDELLHDRKYKAWPGIPADLDR